MNKKQTVPRVLEDIANLPLWDQAFIYSRLHIILKEGRGMGASDTIIKPVSPQKEKKRLGFPFLKKSANGEGADAWVCSSCGGTHTHGPPYQCDE